MILICKLKKRDLFLTKTEKINDEKKKWRKKDNDKEYGATRIDNSTDAGASKFLLGTEQGVLFIVNKKKSEGEIGQKLGLTKRKTFRSYCWYAKKSY